MLIKKIILITIIQLVVNAKAQNINLIPNFSFEETLGCGGTGGYQIQNFLKFWYNPTDKGTPDVFQKCNDDDIPSLISRVKRHKGYVRVGMFTYKLYNPTANAREYIATPLINNLRLNKKYCLDFFLTYETSSRYLTDDFGAYFGVGTQFYIANYNITQITPQLNIPNDTFLIDTAHWYHYSGIYTAQGNETDLILGSFKDDNNINVYVLDTITPLNQNPNQIAYVIIDDVSLHEMSLDIGADITICKGKELTIGELNLDTAFNSYYWYHNGVLFDSLISQKTMSFNEPDSFVVEKRFPCGSVWDTIKINVSYDVCFVKPLTINASNMFSPNNDGINDVFEIKLNGSKFLIKEFSIQNRWGLTLFTQNTETLAYTNVPDIQNNNKSLTLSWDGRAPSGNSLPEGIYYYIFEAENEKGELVQKNGYITLLR